MTADFSWNRALRVAGINLTNEERAAGWPAALTPENLARLQFPCGGSGLEKREAAGNQRDLIAAISKAVQGGALPAVERTRTEDITESRQVPDFYPPRSPHSGGLGSSEWRSRDLPRPMRTVTKKVGERTIPFFVIEREAFRDWLANQGLEPSEHVRAWIDSTEVKAASRPASKPKGQDSPDAQLESILSELEKRAAALGESFSVDNMPGSIREFHELCGRLDPVFKHNLESFKRYKKSGRCKWSLAAKANPSAEPLYRRLFPEAWGAPGAVSGKRANT